MKNLESSLSSILKIVGGVGVLAGSLYLISIDKSYENKMFYCLIGGAGALCLARGAIELEDRGDENSS